VQFDVMEKLLFRKKHILQKSFERKNLSYVVLHEEDKTAKTLRIIQKIKGQGVLYVRNRRKTRELSEYLNRHGISAAFYHAGLDMPARHQVQEAWMKNKIRVIVATNAFGMGIDKSDVRFVIHEDVPECLEAYYQEAGRAGRDERKAFAILLYNKNDRHELEKQSEISFPETDEIKRVYQALANYFQLPVGSGAGENFDFDLGAFCKTYNLPVQTTFSSLKVLELQGLISTTDSLELYSRIRILSHRDSLYEFQVKHEKFDLLIKVLLRSYEGLFDDYIPVKESEIARRAECDEATVIAMLETLKKNQVIDYLKASQSPQLTFLCERLEARDLRIDRQHLAFRKKRHLERLAAMLNYAEKKTRCRNQMLLHYFGEEVNHRCGICDFCLRRNRLGLSDLEFSEVHARVKTLLAKNPCL
jgi:ATP-dependent DNA helicase RecQ